MIKGFLHLVLHAHLPYVHHPEHDGFLEENWLFEAITECYLPLLEMLERLQQDSIRFSLSLSLSPTLMAQLQDQLLQQRYLNHLDKQQRFLQRELTRTRHDSEYLAMARYYLALIEKTRTLYIEKYHGDLLTGFAKHQKNGGLKLITTAATHGFLPLLSKQPAAVEWQIATGVDNFYQTFKQIPDALWLPECAYYRGLENILEKYGIKYFMLDSHGILNADHPPEAGVYSPLDCGNGVMAFGRDSAISELVWSAQSGYPGDGVYREYYSDIGHELQAGDLLPFESPGNGRINTGIKYHQVGQRDSQRLIYQPHTASEKVSQHADDFLQKIQQQLRQCPSGDGQPLPVITVPFDAELFGHWWYEGPQWLEQVLRRSAHDHYAFATITGSQYLDDSESIQKAQPAASSWGHQGYNSYWLNEKNEWIYPLIDQAFDNVSTLISEVAELALTDVQKRALNQALRSILLMQASDWPFLIRSGTAAEFAEKNISDQLARFNYIFDSFRKNRIDERYLTALEIMDDIFPELDFKVFYDVVRRNKNAVE